MSAPSLWLFDLDGTLVDSAGDLHAAAVALCAEEGIAPPSPAAFRERVSQGGTAMLSLTFADADAARIAALLPRFLALYDAAIGRHGRLFAGFDAVLDALDARRLPWGVVTNKPERLARRVLDELHLSSRCAVLIGGDTLAQRKPDPLPLREACARLGFAPDAALYLGDDPRDVQAARAAGMPVLVAGWGYIGAEVDPADWAADGVLQAPAELLALIESEH